MAHSLVSLNHMAASAVGIGTFAAMQGASSPKGILQHIINLFTFGGVRRENEKQYQAFVQSLADELVKTRCDRNRTSPGKIILDDFKGYKVEFSLPGTSNPSGPVVVKVSKDNYSESADIRGDLFEKVCNTLLFREEYSIPQHAIVLTKEGGMYLKGADLSNANLLLENLSYADLSHSKMDGANLHMADLSHADLKNSNLSGVLMNSTNLSDACLEGAILSGGKMDCCTLVNADLKKARLQSSSITNSNFTGANMRFSVLSASDLTGSNLSNCDLNGANLLAANLSNVNFSTANLKKANLDFTNLDNASLSLADLTHTRLNGCNLTNVSTGGAIMAGETQFSFNDYYSENF